jgi:hypothetical protein
MPFLSDEEARHITTRMPAKRDERDALIPPTLTLLDWVRALLDDRRERSAIILALARQLHHLRERLRDAGIYFDKLAAGAHDKTLAPWPGSAACKTCGAPMIKVDQKRRDPAPRNADSHADGKACERTVLLGRKRGEQVG